MNDIIARMRCRTLMQYRGHGDVRDVPDEDCLEAAAEIERLNAENTRLREVLKESKHDLLEIMYSADDPYESSEDYTNNFPWIVQCARTAAERIDAALAEKEQSE